MKTFLLSFLLWITYNSANAQSIGIIESNNHADIYELFSQKNINVHFYKDNFAIISGEYKGELKYTLFEKDGFNNEFNYFIYYTNETELNDLKESISGIGELLYNNKAISLIKIKTDLISLFKPSKNDALVFFDETKAFLTDKNKTKFSFEVNYSDDIVSMIEEINTDSIEATISYLSSYSTRDCYSSEIINALNWISSKFESYGMSVSTQNLTDYGVPSFNIIATQTGTLYPEEYIIVGGHADSRSKDRASPGADDNASGVAGVLEIARILSEYNFERTIIYCAFSGEEYGLYGSRYFANQFKAEDKNILAYVNLDMIGYKASDQPLSTSLIYPSLAKNLANYYKDICTSYFPNLTVIDGTLINADSDHTSFNNAGYMGIFPFENLEHYSPYIHSSSDILGLSVNSFELAENLTGAALATVVSLTEKNTNVSSNDNILETDPIKIYPNPASNYLYISFNEQQDLNVEIYNILGQILTCQTLTQNSTIDVSNLPEGTYIIKLSSKDHSSIRKCIVK